MPEVYEVLEVMAEHGLSLSTGHVTPQESLMLIRAARDAGVDNIYVQHPNHGGVVMPMETMKEMTRMGALIEIVLAAWASPEVDPPRSIQRTR